MTGLNHNIRRTHGFENLTVEGELPDGLRGTLYRVGPGLVDKFGRKVHPFLADGLITAVDIGARPRGACELVKSEKYLQEERLGRDLYSPNAPALRRIYNGLTGQVKNTGNTNVLSWQGRLFALMEQGQPVEFDAAGLATLGSRDLGVIRGSFSAHPHRVERLKTTFNFGIHRRDIVVYALPDRGAISVLCRFRAPWASLIHDFCVTDRHVLFFIDPGKLVVWRAILGGKDFSRYFHWDETAASTIVVIPLNAPEDQIWIEVDPFRVWHFANAFERGGEIIVDAFRHENIDIMKSPTQAPEPGQIADPELYRFRIDPAAGSFRGEQLAQGASEFPVVNPHFTGAEHRYIWMQIYKDGGGNEGFGRYDLKTGERLRYEAPEGHFTSEAMFVPRDGDGSGGGDEAAGWILQLTRDDAAERSYLGIFDAARIGEPPLAKLWFDQAIPATFHGSFVADGGETKDSL